MLDHSPAKTQKQLGNTDKSANPTSSSPACAGLAGEHCIKISAIILRSNLTISHLQCSFPVFKAELSLFLQRNARKYNYSSKTYVLTDIDWSQVNMH